MHVRVACTVAGGRVLVEDGRDRAKAGAGRLLRRALPKSLLRRQTT